MSFFARTQSSLQHLQTSLPPLLCLRSGLVVHHLKSALVVPHLKSALVLRSRSAPDLVVVVVVQTLSLRIFRFHCPQNDLKTSHFHSLSHCWTFYSLNLLLNSFQVHLLKASLKISLFQYLQSDLMISSLALHNKKSFLPALTLFVKISLLHPLESLFSFP